ncbi:hypothetical protein ACS0TY_017359 [Phlomoides rotata]
MHWSLLQVFRAWITITCSSIFENILVQEVLEGRKESPGGPWKFIGLMPLFDPPRHDSAETI